jgi:hypothetical protein
MPLNVVIPPKAAAKEAASAAAAQTRVATDALVLHVYCDGSYKRGHQRMYNPSYRRDYPMKPRGGIGIVVNTWPPRSTTNQRTSKACPIPCSDRKDNNNTAEAFALAEGTHVALDQIAELEKRSAIRPTDGIEITFWTDSQRVLETLQYPVRMRAFPKRTQHVIDIIKLNTNTLQRLRGNVSVQFRWCPEECVEPHKTADELSKRVRISGGSTPSKALGLFFSVSHSSIQSALQKSHKDVNESKADETVETSISSLPDASNSQPDEKMETSISDLPDASDSKPDERIGTSSPSPMDLYFIEVAASHLPVQHKEVMLAAIELQKKYNASKTQQEIPDQAQDSADENYKSAGEDFEHEDAGGREGVHKHEDRSVKREDQARDQGGISDQVEDQPHQAQGGEPGDNGDGDVDDELGIADDAEARPHRMRALWNWVRRRQNP